MSFQIKPLDPATFRPLFGQSDEALAAQGVQRMEVSSNPGFPCRISLADAPVGTSVLLLNHEYMGLASPYRASHAIFVREGAEAYFPKPGEVPDVIARRLISVRAFDGAGMMVDAEVLQGEGVGPVLERMFGDEAVAFVQLHNAGRGCFAANVERA